MEKLSEDGTTIRNGVEKFLEGIISPDELYSTERSVNNTPIHEIIKIEVELSDGKVLPIYDVERYVYDYGSDTYFQEADGYFICYSHPSVYKQSFQEKKACGIKGCLSNHVYVKSVKCIDKNDATLEDLEARYRSINQVYGRTVARVFTDTFDYTLKCGLMKSDGKFVPHFLDADAMDLHFLKLRHVLDKANTLYQGKDLYSCADALMNVIYETGILLNEMQLPVVELWHDVHNSKMTGKPLHNHDIIDDAIANGDNEYPGGDLPMKWSTYSYYKNNEEEYKLEAKSDDVDDVDEDDDDIDIEDEEDEPKKILPRRRTYNAKLNRAKEVKDDEYFTKLKDIEEEMVHYKSEFKDKIVYCNCDHPYHSNFVVYFLQHFNDFGLKRLIATNYMSFLDAERDIVGSMKKAFLFVVNEVGDSTDIDEVIKNSSNVLTVLNGDGDFRSVECQEILKRSDIIITNPPFSLMRDYLVNVADSGKKFITLSSVNTVTYRLCFPLLKDNIMWTGYNIHGMAFERPNGEKDKKIANICWFTNIPVNKGNQFKEFPVNYDPANYAKYLTYDAINIEKIKDIPGDFAGKMGMPVTFFKFYNPNQFELIGGCDFTGKYGLDDIGVEYIPQEWLDAYKKIVRECHYTLKSRALVVYDKDGRPYKPFKRIIVRNKHPRQPAKNL